MIGIQRTSYASAYQLKGCHCIVRLLRRPPWVSANYPIDPIVQTHTCTSHLQKARQSVTQLFDDTELVDTVLVESGCGMRGVRVLLWGALG